MLSNFRRGLNEDGLWVLFSSQLRRASNIVRSFAIGRKLRAKGLRIGPRCTIRGLASITVGSNLQVAEGLWLEAVQKYEAQSFSPKIMIGNNVAISKWSHIAATHRVDIGDGVLIGSKVIITDHNHGQYGASACTSPNIPPACRPLDDNRSVLIGRNVWLGDGVVVTPGATIGEGCVVGANAVVIGEIPAYSIVAGIPAVVIKRFDFERGTWVRAQ